MLLLRTNRYINRVYTREGGLRYGVPIYRQFPSDRTDRDFQCRSSEGVRFGVKGYLAHAIMDFPLIGQRAEPGRWQHEKEPATASEYITLHQTSSTPRNKRELSVSR